MQTIQSKSFNVPVILLLAVTFLTSLKADAHSPIAREVVAVVQAINQDKRTLSLNYPQGHGPQTVIWNSGTTFLCDGKSVPATELKKDMTVTIFYPSPFFGKPFATKVIWNKTN